VSTAPCNDDWFEGQSHKRIASKIADIILDDSQHGIIGIDGGWGSGKSDAWTEGTGQCLAVA
jgi:hypothetical protein